MINCSQITQSTYKSSRFEQVFYNTGVGIMVVDKDRILIEVNPKFCEMLGFTNEELLGKNAKKPQKPKFLRCV